MGLIQYIYLGQSLESSLMPEQAILIDRGVLNVTQVLPSVLHQSLFFDGTNILGALIFLDKMTEHAVG